MADSADIKSWWNFLFFIENRIWYFMQIVFFQILFFRKKRNKYSKMLPAEIFIQHCKVLKFGTPEFLTMLVLKFEQSQFTVYAGWIADSIDPDQMSQTDQQYHLGLHCLLRPLCSNIHA